MCRLFALVSTEPQSIARWVLDEPNALVRQSCGDCHGERHDDGWGVGSYEHGQPRVVRSVQAVEHDAAFRGAVEQVRSRIAFAHVRQASVGASDVHNSHPFTWGPWMFMHNGTVERWDGVVARLEADAAAWLKHREGTTDSQLALLMLLARLERAGVNVAQGADDSAQVAAVLAGLVRDLADWSAEAPGSDSERGATKLNFIVSDGRHLWATRWQYELHSCALDAHTLLIASEPIGAGHWQELAEPSMLTVSPTGRVDWLPL